jgi:hypothetical protein
MLVNVLKEIELIFLQGELKPFFQELMGIHNSTLLDLTMNLLSGLNNELETEVWRRFNDLIETSFSHHIDLLIEIYLRVIQRFVLHFLSVVLNYLSEVGSMEVLKIFLVPIELNEVKVLNAFCMIDL